MQKKNAPEVQADGEAFCNFREGAASDFFGRRYLLVQKHMLPSGHVKIAIENGHL